MRVVLVVASVVIVLGAPSEGEAQPVLPTTALIVKDARGIVLGRLASMTMSGSRPETATMVTANGYLVTLSIATGTPPLTGQPNSEQQVVYLSKDCTGQGYAPVPPSKVAIPNGDRFVVTSGTSVRLTTLSILEKGSCAPNQSATGDVFPAQVLTRAEVGISKPAPPLAIQ